MSGASPKRDADGVGDFAGGGVEVSEEGSGFAQGVDGRACRRWGLKTRRADGAARRDAVRVRVGVHGATGDDVAVFERAREDASVGMLDPSVAVARAGDVSPLEDDAAGGVALADEAGEFAVAPDALAG